MKVSIETTEPLTSLPDDMVGNVYQVRGGVGARHGHLHIIVSSYDRCGHSCGGPGFVTLTVNREGIIVGGNSYAQHYFMEKVPIARCDGIEEISLIVRSL